MTNDSTVAAIQLVVASKRGGGGVETRRLMNGKLDFVRIFVWDVFHLR